MAKNFKVLHTGVGPWRQGDVVSEDHIHELQGDIDSERDATRAARNKTAVQRLLDTKAVEETDDDVHIVGLLPQNVHAPELTKGDNVDPGSDDDVHKRAKRREKAVGKGNTGMPGPDASAPGAPTTGATEVESSDELHALTVADLKAKADGLGVESTSGMNKNELVKEIRKAERNAAK